MVGFAKWISFVLLLVFFLWLLTYLGFFWSGDIKNLGELKWQFDTLKKWCLLAKVISPGITLLGIAALFFFGTRIAKTRQIIIVLTLMSVVLGIGFYCLAFGFDLSKSSKQNETYFLGSNVEVNIENFDSLRTADNQAVILNEGDKILLPQGTIVYIQRAEQSSASSAQDNSAGLETDNGGAGAGAVVVGQLNINPNFVLGSLLIMMFIMMALDGIRVLDFQTGGQFRGLQKYIRKNFKLIYETPGQPYVLLGIIGTFWGLIGLLSSIDVNQIWELANVLGNGNQADNEKFKAFFDTLSANAVLSLVSSAIGISMAFLAHFLIEPPDESTTGTTGTGGTDTGTDTGTIGIEEDAQGQQASQVLTPSPKLEPEPELLPKIALTSRIFSSSKSRAKPDKSKGSKKKKSNADEEEVVEKNSANDLSPVTIKRAEEAAKKKKSETTGKKPK